MTLKVIFTVNFKDGVTSENGITLVATAIVKEGNYFGDCGGQ